MAERRFLVTGAGGFIGRRLCESLAGTGTVRALLRASADGPWDESVVCDLTGAVPAGAAAGVDTVFHLAARTHAVDERGGNERAYRAVNVDGTRRVLESSRTAGVRRFVFMSSVKAAGEGSDVPVDDATPSAPATAYGRTKLAAERLVLDGGYVPEPVVLRPCLVYGPGVKGNVERMIDAVAAGRFPPVPPAPARRSMVHVDDVVTAARLAADAEGVAGHAFIVADGHDYTTREMYEAICAALSRPARRGLPRWCFRALALAGDVAGALTRRRAPFDSEAYEKLFSSALYDGSRLWRVLGHSPKWNLEAALPAMVAARGRQ